MPSCEALSVEDSVRKLKGSASSKFGLGRAVTWVRFMRANTLVEVV